MPAAIVCTLPPGWKPGDTAGWKPATTLFMIPKPFDMARVRVHPLAERKSMARIDDCVVHVDAPPPPCPGPMLDAIRACAAQVAAARQRNASVILMTGAHLIKNGGSALVVALMKGGWITHAAANGATSIHDWEFAAHGVSTEIVEKNVAHGCFGTWLETGRSIHLALLTGALDGLGYGLSVGRMIAEDGVTLPSPDDLARLISADPLDPLTPARVELLHAMRRHGISAGRFAISHAWKRHSMFGEAWRLGVPVTVHPGIGYDIITNHPMFNGAAIGRGAGMDFRLFSSAMDHLDNGVTLSVGSAIMAPQVFEKSMSCINNVRLQEGRSIVTGHQIHVVDLQDGGGWDWSQGEPPKDNPGYYLRFLKSFSRMGGRMIYHSCDNVVFLHNLLAELNRL